MQLNHGSFGVSTGSLVMFSACDEGEDMWTGEGDRYVRQHVDFPKKFHRQPAVQLSISMFDFDQGKNQRADIFAEDVTRDGFTVVFKTWGDTRVARIRADWMAMGAVPDDDELWDV